MKYVYIIGSKGIPSNYGGFETFVDKLTEKKVNKDIYYHISCLSDNDEEFIYNNSRCFNVKTPSIGSAKAILYDVKALEKCINHIEENNVKNAIIYILACRIGPFLKYYKSKINKLGAKIFVNPDGHEWKRSKWSKPVKLYWKLSEKLMVKYSDLLICDSKAIEQYIVEEYSAYKPKTTYISYGAEMKKSVIVDRDDKLIDWYKKFDIKENDYYLIVGRFVPENNYEVAIREFMNSNSKKDLVIITNVCENNFYKELKKNTNFITDNRIKFVGTVYDQELLMKIREEAFAYIHGHEVGGTNPSLLEALASTKLNLLLDVIFNREVAQDGALYFSKKEGSLTNIISEVEQLNEETINYYELAAKKRIMNEFSWKKIIESYELIFIN